jgi:hypothetical protein
MFQSIVLFAQIKLLIETLTYTGWRREEVKAAAEGGGYFENGRMWKNLSNYR